MAENAESEPKLPAVFDDSGDQWSFDGLEGRCRDYDSDADVDLVGLEDDNGSPAPGGTNDEVEEAQWTDHLSDFPIPDVTAPSSLNFNLPDIPNPLRYFAEFGLIYLWDLIVVRKKLSNSPECLTNFVPVTRAEIKAFITISIIMGINSLPQLALYWSSDDYFGNQGIKKVMTTNRFEEIQAYQIFFPRGPSTVVVVISKFFAKFLHCPTIDGE